MFLAGFFAKSSLSVPLSTWITGTVPGNYDHPDIGKDHLAVPQVGEARNT
jgi:hypothetical protein